MGEWSSYAIYRDSDGKIKEMTMHDWHKLSVGDRNDKGIKLLEFYNKELSQHRRYVRKRYNIG